MTPQEVEDYTGGLDCRCYGNGTVVDVECKTGGAFDGLCRVICQGDDGNKYSIPVGHPERCKCRLGVARDPESEVFMEDETGITWGFATCRDPSELKDASKSDNNVMWWVAGAAALGFFAYAVRR